MSTPEEIERRIERTRTELSSNVDRLSEKVTPSKVVGRRVEGIKSGATGLRERVMGSAGDSGRTRQAGESVGSVASSAKNAASSAPSAIRYQTQGNPLAAGLIAFGAGWLLSSLAPASPPEQELAGQAESKAKQFTEPLKQTGQDMAEQLKQPLQDSIAQVKSSATDAAQQTTDHARAAAEDVAQPLQH